MLVVQDDFFAAMLPVEALGDLPHGRIGASVFGVNGNEEGNGEAGGVICGVEGGEQPLQRLRTVVCRHDDGGFHFVLPSEFWMTSQGNGEAIFPSRRFRARARGE